jgi:ATP-dependent Clp protease adaptor protein ClpS
MENIDPKEKAETVVKERTEIIIPKMFKVILKNDDYTPMDFVVSVLMKFFEKQASEATKIMLDIHKKGRGVCGIYIFDVARTKALHVNLYARENNFPLMCSVESE